MATTHEITRNLGGDRLGSGAKNNITMHNYSRSNHDLSYAWRSSMNVGTLVPFMKLFEENGDGFEINLQTLVKTIPTIGPLYGAFKLQLDVFECPVRLYNGLLHNNMTKIGLDMKQVKFPKVELETTVDNPLYITQDFNCSQISQSSILAYLGIRGVGDYKGTWDSRTQKATITRKFNGTPFLAYWDIYKNYYANKQEEIGVVFTTDETVQYGFFTELMGFEPNNSSMHTSGNPVVTEYWKSAETSTLPTGVTITQDTYQELQRAVPIQSNLYYRFATEGPINIRNIDVIFFGGTVVALTTVFPTAHVNTTSGDIIAGMATATYYGNAILGLAYDKRWYYRTGKKLQTFDLSNIDDARIEILKDTGLGNEFVINTKLTKYPYLTIYGQDGDNYLLCKQDQCGLGIKTYQSDLLQNWLSTDWIDGVNGINAITAVDTSSGSFEIDALNLANKVYNMLNRIAVSGGTYEDWQEAVFTANVNRRAETPIYKGGLACEIIFDEVVSTAETDGKPLGTLGGRAIIPKEGIRGGHIEIKCEEPSYIIGIVSITPRIDYSQGNDWDMTELDTLDDIHKPALDGIGFEDLLQERAAWFGTYTTDGTTWNKLAMGKTPAWMNYMTNFNKTYGDFTKENISMWMTLNRRYERDDHTNGIHDLTTYIDPSKYNYCFADSSIDAQNFWVQIGVEVKARRVMSAKILPNL